MKKLVLILLPWLLYTNCAKCQGNTMYPIGDNYIPTWQIDNENLNISYPGNLHLGSAQSGMIGGGSFTIEGSSDITIKAKAINLKNTHLGSTDPNFKVHASVKSMSLASNYNYTNGTPQVPLFEKIEFGIELPEDIQNKIDLFLNSNTSAANPNHSGLNPYDPQDISVEATVTGTITDFKYPTHQLQYGENLPSSVTVYGFYFQEATPSSDLMSWAVNTATPYPFRVRMAPPYKGNYHVTFKVTYWNNGTYTTLDLSSTTISPQANATGTFTLDFDGVANNSGKAIAKGYLQVGQDKRHLRHGYDKTSFFPIGMNVPQVIFSNSNDDIAPLNTPLGLSNRRYEFTQLAANGGNYARILSFGDRGDNITGGGANCVEITHRRSNDPFYLIGNYQINQDKMSETDLDIQTFENSGIFATWCLQTYGFDDIPNTNDYYASWSINPYKYELNKNNVTDFFTDPDCQRFFKNRLRYIQARWGYSASIAIYQMESEIDDFGRYKSGNNWVCPYRVNSSYAVNGQQWQITMAAHLKSIYPNHLISSSYVANPTQPVTTDPNEFPIVCYDKFISYDVCDIVSWNPYAMASPSNSAEELNRGRWNAVNLINYNPTVIEECNPERNRFTDKPIFFSEAGMNDGFNIDPFTDIQMHNMIWATACSGMLGTGLNWQGWEAYTSGSQIEKKFQHFSAISSFFDDIDFETHKYTPSVKDEEGLIDPKGSMDGPFEGDMGLEIFVMANDNSGIGEKSDRGFGWVHHRDANWNQKVSPRLVPDDPATNDINEAYYVFDPTTISTLSTISNDIYNYKLNGFKTGDYFIEIYNSYTGSLILSSSTNNDLIHANLLNVLTLGLPHVMLYKNSETDFRFDYTFKFWHVSTNGNDLRIAPMKNSLDCSSNSIVLPGNDGNLKKYFHVSMVPNPAYENINISSAGENINAVSITDLSGNLIYNESSINLQNLDVSIVHLSSGVYFVHVKSYSAITKIFKFIKL